MKCAKCGKEFVPEWDEQGKLTTNLCDVCDVSYDDGEEK